ncbi:hypothetical protein [Streptomyces triculaminicus]|uniref:hypothetical protein n=1 Tax=Streptomyces triculaminicus TaxID=2816232 RepID=UPI00378A6E05
MNSALERFDDTAVALLGNLPLWRLRAVERVELSKAFWSEREREIHVQPLREVMKKDVDLRGNLMGLGAASSDEVELVLPVTEFPKVPLLDLKITVDGQEVSRISRDESARIQAHHLASLGRRAGLTKTVEPHMIDLLTFIFYFPHEPYENIWEKHRVRFFDSLYAWQDAPHRYIKEEGQSFGFDAAGAWREWHESVRRIPELIEGYTSPDHLSGSQVPLISLPYFYREMRDRADRGLIDGVPTANKVTLLLRNLSDLLFAAKDKVSDGAADQVSRELSRRFLSTYFSYGHRWMAMTHCTVPLDRPFIIRTKANRAIYFTPHPQRKPSLWRQIRKEAWQMVPFADAETNHVSVRIEDTAVRLGSPKIYDECRKEIKSAVDEEENTFELYFRQDSTRGRKERIYIKCPLRLTRFHSMMLYVVMAATALGFALLLNRGLGDAGEAFVPAPGTRAPKVDNGLTAKDATLILVPVALAASFLLFKDSSTMSAWLRKVRQSILLVELFLLLGTAFVLLFIHHVKTD